MQTIHRGKEGVHHLHPSDCAAGGGGCSAAASPREDEGVEEEEGQEGGEENACQGEEAEGVGEFQGTIVDMYLHM